MALILLVWASAVVFLAATAVRIVGYARLPLHLRWELYPVPHEAPEQAAHGGSYFEQSDWWTRPRYRGRFGTLRVMLAEMLLLKALHEHNPRLWWRSFPFHLGLYLLAASLLLLLVNVLQELVTAGAETAISQGLFQVYRATGAAGLALTLFGAMALLHRRLTDPDLRGYTAPADAFNLLLFLLALGLLASGHLAAGEEGPGASAVLTAVLTFDAGLRVPPLLAAGIALSALLAAYIPLTHMAHFVAKWFTWHGVRWEDEPLVPGSRLERRIVELLATRPSWAARHIGADGRRTWAELVSTRPGDREEP